MDPLQVALVSVVFAIAGAVKGLSGMGLPTVAISLLGLFLTPAHAASLLVLPSLATKLPQCRGPSLRALATKLWPLWLALFIATALTPTPDIGTSASTARTLLGSVLIVYGLWGL